MAFCWTRTIQRYSKRSSARKPKDIKGGRAYVANASVGQVKRALKGVPGITKVRSYGPNPAGDPLVEVIHTFNHDYWTLRNALETAGLCEYSFSYWCRKIP